MPPDSKKAARQGRPFSLFLIVAAAECVILAAMRLGDPRKITTGPPSERGCREGAVGTSGGQAKVELGMSAPQGPPEPEPKFPAPDPDPEREPPGPSPVPVHEPVHGEFVSHAATGV